MNERAPALLLAAFCCGVPAATVKAETAELVVAVERWTPLQRKEPFRDISGFQVRTVGGPLAGATCDEADASGSLRCTVPCQRGKKASLSVAAPDVTAQFSEFLQPDSKKFIVDSCRPTPARLTMVLIHQQYGGYQNIQLEAPQVAQALLIDRPDGLSGPGFFVSPEQGKLRLAEIAKDPKGRAEIDRFRAIAASLDANAEKGAFKSKGILADAKSADALGIGATDVLLREKYRTVSPTGGKELDVLPIATTQAQFEASLSKMRTELAKRPPSAQDKPFRADIDTLVKQPAKPYAFKAFRSDAMRLQRVQPNVLLKEKSVIKEKNVAQ